MIDDPGSDAKRSEIIRGLEVLSQQMQKQMTVWYAFRNGVIYGIGFVVGSTVLTALLVTFGFTFFGDTIFGDVIAWIIATN